MTATALALLLAAVAPASPSPRGAAAAEHAPAPRLHRGVLRLEGIDRAAFVDALALRVPELRLETLGEGPAVEPDEPVAFIDLRPAAQPTPEGTPRFSLTIVVSDGRAFDREVDLGPDEAESARLLASTVANLLQAIEAGTVKADRADVPLPTAAPACPACACPAAPECPAPRDTTEPTPAEPKPATPDRARPGPRSRLQLGPVVSISALLGLGAPAQADRFAAYGATVGLHARLPRGLFFGAELRGVGRGEPSGTSLVRLRVAAGAGYRLRHRAFSLGASLWATVEPWWLRGAPIDPPPVPLLGLAARLSPAILEERLGDRDLALMIGPILELSTSAAFEEHGPRIDLITVRDGGEVSRHLRVGGVELSAGLSITLWLDAPRRR